MPLRDRADGGSKENQKKMKKRKVRNCCNSECKKKLHKGTHWKIEDEDYCHMCWRKQRRKLDPVISRKRSRPKRKVGTLREGLSNKLLHMKKPLKKVEKEVLARELAKEGLTPKEIKDHFIRAELEIVNSHNIEKKRLKSIEKKRLKSIPFSEKFSELKHGVVA